MRDLGFRVFGMIYVNLFRALRLRITAHQSSFR